jgi:glycosyltransferase involved in cell wall biosynthesis
MRSENISVCMATFNGAKYIIHQLNSIIKQLKDEDELIIIDDSSTDSTVELLNDNIDPRIKIIVNEINIGVNKSFEKAIKLAKNDYIFMADQDDIWPENRVEKMMDIFRSKNVNLISGNSEYIDSVGNEISYPIIPLKVADSYKLYKNLIKIFLGRGSYFGCAMAFNRDLLSGILPFPRYIESHDLWIAKASILQGKSYHLEDIILYRRIHGSNASVIQRPLLKKIYSRILFGVSLVSLLLRAFNQKYKNKFY